MRKRDSEAAMARLREYVYEARTYGPADWKRYFSCYIWDQWRTRECGSYFPEDAPHANDRWCLQVGNHTWFCFPTKEAAQAKAVELVLLDLAGRIHYRRPR